MVKLPLTPKMTNAQASAATLSPSATVLFQPPPQALRFSQGRGERLVRNRKGPWEGYRRLSPSRLPITYYLPLFYFQLNNLFCLIVDQQPSPKIVLLTTLFSFLHALANPLLYGWMSQRYRRGYIFVFKMVLSACGGHRPDRRTLGELDTN